MPHINTMYTSQHNSFDDSATSEPTNHFVTNDIHTEQGDNTARMKRRNEQLKYNKNLKHFGTTKKFKIKHKGRNNKSISKKEPEDFEYKNLRMVRVGSKSSATHNDLFSSDRNFEENIPAQQVDNISKFIWI